MTDALKELFDTYSRRARLLPGLLTMLPGAIVVVATMPAAYATVISSVVSLALSSGAIYGLANLGRYLGRQQEKRLIQLWGGLHSAIWLRWRDDNIDSVTKARYHSFLEKRVGGLTMPSKEEEGIDQKNADAMYRSSIKWLMEQTRDVKEFPILFEENVSYGFRRNLLGLKPIALTLLGGCVAWLLGSSFLANGAASIDFQPNSLIALLFCALATLFWVFVVRDKWVEDASEAYARALLTACDGLSEK